jgi:hypothetical protein
MKLKMAVELICIEGADMLGKIYDYLTEIKSIDDSSLVKSPSV